jgi:hypothetical protein
MNEMMIYEFFRPMLASEQGFQASTGFQEAMNDEQYEWDKPFQ